MRIEIRLHDQVRRLAVGQPHAADRRHRRADHDGLENCRPWCGCEHQDDDERPDREADHRDAVENARCKRHDRRNRNDRRQESAPSLRRSRKNVTPSSMRVCAMTATKKVSPRMNSIVSAWMRLSSPSNDSRCSRIHAHVSGLGDLAMPFGRLEAGECRDGNERHAVGEGVLVNLVLERTEQNNPRIVANSSAASKRDRQRRHAAQAEQQACDNGASDHETCAPTSSPPPSRLRSSARNHKVTAR